MKQSISILIMFLALLITSCKDETPQQQILECVLPPTYKTFFGTLKYDSYIKSNVIIIDKVLDAKNEDITDHLHGHISITQSALIIPDTITIEPINGVASISAWVYQEYTIINQTRYIKISHFSNSRSSNPEMDLPPCDILHLE